MGLATVASSGAQSLLQREAHGHSEARAGSAPYLFHHGHTMPLAGQGWKKEGWQILKLNFGFRVSGEETTHSAESPMLRSEASGHLLVFHFPDMTLLQASTRARQNLESTVSLGQNTIS